MTDLRRISTNHDPTFRNHHEQNVRREENFKPKDVWVRRPNINYMKRDGRIRKNIPYPRDNLRPKIDRTKTCPLLIRLFINLEKHNKASDYKDTSYPENELRIYTWRDATLKEISQLISDAYPETKIAGTCFDFNTVYPNFKTRSFNMRELGSTCFGQERVDDNISLETTKFHVGDILDVAIYPPRSLNPK